MRPKKIDGSIFETFEMILSSFQVGNKFVQIWFFQKIFLLAATNIKIILKMFFLILSSKAIVFVNKKLIWKSYTATKALPTTKQVKLIHKKEFAKAVFDENFKPFVMHIMALETLPRSM